MEIAMAEAEASVPNPHGGRGGRPALVLLAGLLLVQALCLALSNSLPQRLHKILVRGDRTSLQMVEGLDAFLDQAVPDGNLFVQFDGFDQMPGGGHAPTLIYFRAVYHLWPRRVYTGPEDRIITRGDNLTVPQPTPDPAWLAARGIRHWLVFRGDGSGAVSWEDVPIETAGAPPPPPSQATAAFTVGGYAWTALYLAAILLLGVGLRGWLGSATTAPLALSLAESWLHGVAGTGLLLFLLALTGMPVQRPMLLALLAVAAALFASTHPWRHWRHRPAKSPVFRNSLPEKMLHGAAILILAIAVGLVALHALALPVHDVDGFALWGLKAKALFTSGLGADYFRQVNYGFSQLDYPLLGPLLGAGMHAAGDTVADDFARLPLLLTHAAFAGALVLRLRAWVPTVVATVLTATLFTTAAMIQWAGGGSMDVLVGCLYMASAGSLATYVARREPGDLRTACLFAVALAFTKNEGMPLVAINLLALFLTVAIFPSPSRRADLRHVGLAALAILALWLPWGLWGRGLPHLYENYPAQLPRLATAAAWARLPAIALDFSSHLLQWRRWGLLWLIVPAATLLAIQLRRRIPAPVVAALLLMGLGHLALYIMVYLISPWSLENLRAAATERLLLHLAPLVPLLAATILPRLPEPPETEP
jgi:hypothetical protein